MMSENISKLHIISSALEVMQQDINKQLLQTTKGIMKKDDFGDLLCFPIFDEKPLRSWILTLMSSKKVTFAFLSFIYLSIRKEYLFFLFHVNNIFLTSYGDVGI